MSHYHFYPDFSQDWETLTLEQITIQDKEAQAAIASIKLRLLTLEENGAEEERIQRALKTKARLNAFRCRLAVEGTKRKKYEVTLIDKLKEVHPEMYNNLCLLVGKP